MPSLADKLKSMGVKVGTQNLPPPIPSITYPVEDIIPGRLADTHAGPVYLAEEIYPSHHKHGNYPLHVSTPIQMIAEWAGEPEIASLPIESFAFLDTETSGLAGGTGTFAFMVGVGRFESQGFHLAQFFLRDPLEEAALLLALEQFVAPCQVIVSFNGKAFDIPLLNTRYILQGWKTPFAGFHQIDLLHLARRIWRDRLPSRTLSNLEAQILHIQRGEEEVPGWMIPQMYFDYLRQRDARPLRRVFYHNQIDVLSMAALLEHLGLLLADPINKAAGYGLDQAAIARLLEELGYTQTAAHLYHHSLESGLPDAIAHDTLQRLALLFKRQGDYTAALPLWEKAAGQQQVYAFVELAKYHEHHLQDFGQALYWTRAAIKLMNTPHFSRLERRQWQGELNHRLQRLEKKQSRQKS
ncbi:MAG: ribonuclease H-like domain-containing protein [Anaerolineales bacterium]|nr:ribonuclease H-like domain-containing protein [Anaerolineales bacterium]